MRRLPLAVFGMLFMVASAHAEKPKPAQPSDPTQQNPNDCAKAQGNARFEGMGYTHSITLKNTCAKAVECTVWTDADPEPKQTVNAAAGQSVDVVTRKGSPAREVKASSTCRFR